MQNEKTNQQQIVAETTENVSVQKMPSFRSQPSSLGKLTAALNPFRKPAAHTLALEELQEAERQLLQAQTAMEYAKNMVDYNRARVTRLRKYLSEEFSNG
jgi:hypothetical protein